MPYPPLPWLRLLVVLLVAADCGASQRQQPPSAEPGGTEPYSDWLDALIRQAVTAATEPLLRTLTDRLETLDSQLDVLATRLDNQDHKLDGLPTRLDNQDHKLDGMATIRNSELDNYSSKLDGLMVRLDNQDFKMDGLVNKLSSQDSKFDQVFSNLSSQGSKLDGLVTGLSGQDFKLNELATSLSSQDSKLNGLATSLSKQDSKLDGQTTQLSSQDSELSGLVTSMSSQDSKLDGLTTQLSSQDSELSGLATSLSSQDSKLDGLATSLSSQDSKLDGLATSLSSQDSKLDGLVTSLSRQDSKLSGLVTQTEQVYTNMTTRTLPPRDCSELPARSQSGIYLLQLGLDSRQPPVPAFCDLDTDGGNWTVIQRRADKQPRQDFFRNWAAYKEGFGELDAEFWWGLGHVHTMTSPRDRQYELRIDLEDFDDVRRFAVYQSFSIASESDGYRLMAGNYTGNAGDNLKYHVGQMFTTKDKDQDQSESSNCAVDRNGGFWYNRCTETNLNGPYLSGVSPDKDGISWYAWRGRYYSLKAVDMKIRPT